jgi:hypothetical protein
VLHRRFGKTVLAINELIDRGLNNPLKNPQYAYFAPFHGQAKRVAWEYMKDYTKQFPGINVNEAELRVDIPRPNPDPTREDKIRFLLLGADNPTAIRGMYFDGIVLDEYAEMDPQIWTQVLRPTLSDRNGWALFIGTPRGQNHFYDIWKLAEKDVTGKWYYKMFKASETGIISKSELLEAQSMMSPEEYAQEFECFPPGTLVATIRGHIPIEQLRLGDSVLTHKNRWRPVQGTMQKFFTGDLISVFTYGSGEPLLCTPEHPFLVCKKESREREWKRASDLCVQDCLVLPKKNRGIECVSETLARLLAWYICEGSVNGNLVQFSLNPKSLEEISHVRELLDSMGFAVKSYSKGNLIICDVAFADFLAASCGCLAENKRIPFDLISGHEDVFFEELIRGDGCVVETMQGGKRFAYTTTSKGLAYDVLLLCGSLGRRAGIVFRPAHKGNILGRDVDCRESYSVQISNGFKVNHSSLRQAFPTKLGVAYRVREILKVPYSGVVHNLSVKEDESYVVQGRAVHNCSFTAALVGAYYGKEMEAAEKEGRVGKVPYDPAVPVDTAWDLGIGDTTVIWFMQQVGREFRAIDYVEDSGRGMDYYAKILKDKRYVYREHYLPHDAAAKELGTGRSREETLRSLGVSPTRIVPRQSIEDGINACRMLIPKFWFDAVKCERGITCLKNYERQWDAKNKIYSTKPLHNWASHGSDAFRSFAMGMRDNTVRTNVKHLPRISESDYDILG